MKNGLKAAAELLLALVCVKLALQVFNAILPECLVLAALGFAGWLFVKIKR